MKPLTRTIEESNHAGKGFLLVEMDAASTFLDVAGTTAQPDVARRNRDHAHEAYVTILRYLDRVRFEEGEKSAFDSRLGVLRERLAEIGYPV